MTINAILHDFPQFFNFLMIGTWMIKHDNTTVFYVVQPSLHREVCVLPKYCPERSMRTDRRNSLDVLNARVNTFVEGAISEVGRAFIIIIQGR